MSDSPPTNEDHLQDLDDEAKRRRDSVADLLDKIGKDLPEDTFRNFLNWAEASGGDSAINYRRLFQQLGFRIKVVVDACAIQQIITYRLSGKRSGVLDGFRSGIYHALAPEHLDYEIANHAIEMAERAEARPNQVLKVYFREIRPHLDFSPVENDAAFEEARARITDEDDIPYVAVYLEYDAAAILTNDKHIRSDPDIRSYTVGEAAKIHVTHRKGATVFMLEAGTALGAMVLVRMLIDFLSLLLMGLRFLVRYWQIALLVAGAGGLLYWIFKGRMDAILDDIASAAGERWSESKAGLLQLWKDNSPFVLALLAECADRAAEACDSEILVSPTILHENSRDPVGINDTPSLQKMLRYVLLAHRKPLTSPGLTLLIAMLGCANGDEVYEQEEVEDALDSSGLFSRTADNKYCLVESERE